MLRALLFLVVILTNAIYVGLGVGFGRRNGKNGRLTMMGKTFMPRIFGDGSRTARLRTLIGESFELFMNKVIFPSLANFAHLCFSSFFPFAMLSRHQST